MCQPKSFVSTVRKEQKNMKHYYEFKYTTESNEYRREGKTEGTGLRLEGKRGKTRKDNEE